MLMQSPVQYKNLPRESKEKKSMKSKSSYFVRLLTLFALGLFGSKSFAGNCHSSITSCPAATATNFEAPLLTSTAKASSAGCVQAVEALKATCKIHDPISVMFFVGGVIEYQAVLVTPRIPASVPSGASCTVGGHVVAHGSSVERWKVTAAYQPSICVSQTRTCNNGVLSGTYTALTCREHCGRPGSTQACY